MKTRIYIVRVEGQKPRLVRAGHPSNAFQHVVRNLAKVEVATQDDLVKAVAEGIKVEDVKPEQGVIGGE